MLDAGNSNVLNKEEFQPEEKKVEKSLKNMTEMEDAYVLDNKELELFDEIEAAYYMAISENFSDKDQKEIHIINDYSPDHVNARKRRKVASKLVSTPYIGNFGSAAEESRKVAAARKYVLDDFAYLGDEIMNQTKLREFEKFLRKNRHDARNIRKHWYPPRFDAMDDFGNKQQYILR